MFLGIGIHLSSSINIIYIAVNYIVWVYGELACCTKGSRVDPNSFRGLSLLRVCEDPTVKKSSVYVNNLHCI